MTTAYILEVTIADKASYVGKGAKIVTIPKFFNNAGAVRRVLNNPWSAAYGNNAYGVTHKDHTKVIQIKNLELGLKQSFATIMTVDEFLAKDFTKSGLKIPNNKKAVYMIQLATPLNLATTADPVYVQEVGLRKSKFGHQWQTAGFLRSHITSRLERLNGGYKGAKVVEIEMDKDGFTPTTVKSYPIVDFYCASATSREQYKQKYGAYTPTSPEYA